MSNTNGFLKGATIELGLNRPSDDGNGIDHLFLVKLPSGDLYRFTVKIERAKNGTDYEMSIGDFGALGLHELTYRTFSEDQIVEVKKFIEEYFLTHTIRYFSSLVSRGRLLGFHYRGNWIIKGGGELYKLTDNGSKPGLAIKDFFTLC